MEDNRSENESDFIFDNDTFEYSDLSSSKQDQLSEVLMKISKDDLIIMLLYHRQNKQDSEDNEQNNLNIPPDVEIRVVKVLTKVEKEKLVELIMQYRKEENIKEHISDLTDLDYDELKDKNEQENKNSDEDDQNSTNEKIDDEEDKLSDEDDQNSTNEKIEIEEKLDFNFGEKILIKRTSKTEEIVQDINLSLIKNMDIEDVIFIRYHKLSEDKIKNILDLTENIHIINVGCSQTLPPHLKSRVETTEIQKPKDLKRLGILSTGAVKDTDENTLISFDDIDTLIKYVGIEKLFKFLHMFLSKSTDSKTIAKLSINKYSTDIKNLNTINPLFDDVIDLE